MRFNRSWNSLGFSQPIVKQSSTVLGEGELERFVRAATELTGAEDLHPDDALPLLLHLAQHGDDRVRVGVHGDLRGIEPREIDVHPLAVGRNLEGAEVVARRSVRANDPLLLGLFEDGHRARLLLRPVRVEHAVQQQDVDAVGAHLPSEAIEVVPHLLLGARVRLAEDDDVVALDGLQGELGVRVTAVLIGEVPEVDAVIHAAHQQLGEPLVAHLPDLIRAVVDAVGTGALGEPGHLDPGLAERDHVLGALTDVGGVEVIGEVPEPERRRSGCRGGRPKEVTPLHAQFLSYAFTRCYANGGPGVKAPGSKGLKCAPSCPDRSSS